MPRYTINEQDTAPSENRLWYIEDEETGDCLMNHFESPHLAERWLEEYLAETTCADDVKGEG